MKRDSSWKRDDTIIVLYYEPSQHLDDLRQAFRPLAQYTQQSHPLMMEPIYPDVQGIAFSDQDGRYMTVSNFFIRTLASSLPDTEVTSAIY